MKNEEAPSGFFIRNSKFEILLPAVAALLTNFLYYAFSASDYLFPDSLTYLVPESAAVTRRFEVRGSRFE
jgi:hypothetical protein